MHERRVYHLFACIAVVILSLVARPGLSHPADFLIPVSTTPVAGLSESFWSDAQIVSVPSASVGSNVTIWLKYDLVNRSVCIKFRGRDDTPDRDDAFNARFDFELTRRENLGPNSWWFFIYRGGSIHTLWYNDSTRGWVGGRYNWIGWSANYSAYWEAGFSVPLQVTGDRAFGLCLWQQDVSLPPRTWRLSQPFPTDARRESPSTWAQVRLDRTTRLQISVAPEEAGFDPILRRSSVDVMVTGSMAPGIATTITLTFIRPDGSTFTKEVTADQSGAFTYTMAPDMVGTWGVRASWPGNSDLDPSASDQVLLRVSYSWVTAAGVVVVAAIAIGVLLWWRRRSVRAPPPPPPP